MPDRPRPDWCGRRQKLRIRLDALGLAGLVVSAPVNIRYLSGFSGSAGLLLIAADDAWLVADGRYEFAIREGLISGAIGPVTFERVHSRYDLTLAALALRLGLTRVGFEADHVTLSVLTSWERAGPTIEWQAIDQCIAPLRSIKDSGEVEIMCDAGRRLAAVAADLPAWVVSGRSEQSVAADIDRALVRAGFSAPAFPTIVAAGPHSAHPHARPTDRPLAAGDLVVLDFGGVLDGYCVDLTRMAAVGQVTPARRALFDAVWEAQRAALAAVRPGIPGSVVDRAARDVLEARDLGAAFLHATGHGLGLEVHEAPRIGRADPDAPGLIEAGMVFTVEPGAYVEGLGGVRLEDDVLVTAEGAVVLTDGPRDLLVV
jgi:Xaa-Pro aminopeptidase